MIVGSCVNFSACSRLSVGLKDIVETLTGDAATLSRLILNSFEYLRVPVEMGLQIGCYRQPSHRRGAH